MGGTDCAGNAPVWLEFRASQVVIGVTGGRALHSTATAVDRADELVADAKVRGDRNMSGVLARLRVVGYVGLAILNRDEVASRGKREDSRTRCWATRWLGLDTKDHKWKSVRCSGMSVFAGEATAIADLKVERGTCGRACCSCVQSRDRSGGDSSDKGRKSKEELHLELKSRK